MPSARYIPPEAELVDDTDTLKLCLADLYATPAPAAIAIDLEGIDLCRHGKISIIQLYAHKSKTVWIIDVTTLKDDAFDEKDDRGYSLRGLLEDKDIKKVRFSVLVLFLESSRVDCRFSSMSGTTQMPCTSITTLILKVPTTSKFSNSSSVEQTAEEQRSSTVSRKQ